MKYVILHVPHQLITKVKFILSSGLLFWLVNHTSIYENYEFNVFRNIKIVGKISNNWINDLIETNVYKNLESCWWSLLTMLQWSNITSVISK